MNGYVVLSASYFFLLRLYNQISFRNVSSDWHPHRRRRFQPSSSDHHTLQGLTPHQPRKSFTPSDSLHHDFIPQSLRLFYKIILREAVSEVNVWGLCFLRVIINFAPRVCLLDFCSMNFILAHFCCNSSQQIENQTLTHVRRAFSPRQVSLDNTDQIELVSFL